MQKEIHFYSYSGPNIINSWESTATAIDANEPYICTLQMGFLYCSLELFSRGYRIFIHESPENFYEIRLGNENERTNREIRPSHNLFKMWVAGEFDV